MWQLWRRRQAIQQIKFHIHPAAHKLNNNGIVERIITPNFLVSFVPYGLKLSVIGNGANLDYFSCITHIKRITYAFETFFFISCCCSFNISVFLYWLYPKKFKKRRRKNLHYSYFECSNSTNKTTLKTHWYIH